MAEYIEREALLSAYDREHKGPPGQARKLIEQAPAADVAPVRRGEWQGTADGYADGELVFDMWECSECGFDADGSEEKPSWKFCPNCGVRMDGGADDATD